MDSPDTESLASALAGRTVLVTGGAGFIGGHLCAALDRAGASVRVLDDLSTGRRENLPRGAELVVGDVADERAVRRAIAGCRHVIHLAAMVSVPLSIDDPTRCARTNITGTESVLRAAVEGGVESVVHASSAAVYGPEPSVPSRPCRRSSAVAIRATTAGRHAMGRPVGAEAGHRAASSSWLRSAGWRLGAVRGLVGSRTDMALSARCAASSSWARLRQSQCS
jgi:nucleoside-diphosphate-sugar epimerase